MTLHPVCRRGPHDAATSSARWPGPAALPSEPRRDAGPPRPVPVHALRAMPGSCRRAVRGRARLWAAVLPLLAAGCDAPPRRAPAPIPEPAPHAAGPRDHEAEPAAAPVAAEPAAEQLPATFRVVADEFEVDPPRIRVQAGATVTITFAVRTERVYFGGIDFRSDVVDTDTILAGTERTITFTAPGRSFTFLAYWPATGVPKEARLEVEVD